MPFSRTSRTMAAASAWPSFGVEAHHFQLPPPELRVPLAPAGLARRGPVRQRVRREQPQQLQGQERGGRQDRPGTAARQGQQQGGCGGEHQPWREGHQLHHRRRPRPPGPHGRRTAPPRERQQDRRDAASGGARRRPVTGRPDRPGELSWHESKQSRPPFDGPRRIRRSSTSSRQAEPSKRRRPVRSPNVYHPVVRRPAPRWPDVGRGTAPWQAQLHTHQSGDPFHANPDEAWRRRTQRSPAPQHRCPGPGSRHEPQRHGQPLRPCKPTAADSA